MQTKAELLHYKSVPLQIKEIDEEEGIFEGYGSVFGNIDAYDEVMVRGCFEKSLAAKKSSGIKLLWQHRSDEPIGVYEEIYEDEKGLYVRGKLLVKSVNRAKECFALLKAGALDGLSIGFAYVDTNFGQDGIRYLKEVDLWEVSVVTFPANTNALVSTVKAANIGEIKTINDYERFLRDAGFSRKKATALAIHGFKAISQSDSADEMETILAAVNALKNNIEETINGRFKSGSQTNS